MGLGRRGDSGPVITRAARRIRRLLRPDPVVKRIEILVGASSASRGPVNDEQRVPSAATARSIEVAQAVLTTGTTATTARPARTPVAVSTHTFCSQFVVDQLSRDPTTLWLFVVDGAELEPNALAHLIELFNRDPNLDLAYGDARARVPVPSPSPTSAEADGPWLLPGFSPHRLHDHFYLGHVVAVRPHRLVATDEATRSGSLAVSEMTGPWSLASAARTAAHLPLPLYVPAPPTPTSDLDGSGWSGDVRPSAAPVMSGRTRWPPVSVVIPTNGSYRTLDRGPTVLVEQAVASVAESDYPDIEIVVVETPGSPPDLAARLAAVVANAGPATGRSFTTVADMRTFNFSNACNRGAVHARGEMVVFLNDDTKVIASDWLHHLVDRGLQPDVGAVGARLLYEDGRVQHSGIWSRGGHPTHRYEGAAGDAVGYRNSLQVAQNCLAVTGACLAVERAKFVAVGGFSPVFPNSYNDVDLCLKLWDKGWATVVEPRAELYHFEASTRDPSITDDDLVALHDRWRWRLNHDPFDHPAHTAPRSEELPLDGVAEKLAGFADEAPPARRWPLPPVVTTVER